MAVRDALIRLLADGQPHSGTGLAAALGVSRSAVWKQAHRLGELGLELQSVARGGYRLARPVQLLDHAAILAPLPASLRDTCERLEVRTVTGSTSADLLAAPAPAPGRWQALLAEFQTSGRGRRGHRWFAAFGSSLCLSVAWRYAAAPRELPALSLAAGVAVRRALERAGATGVMLKWPNDIVLDNGKLGGVLVDVEGDSRGPLRVVVGVGLNLVVPPELARAVLAGGGLPPVGLEQALAGVPLSRNALAAGVVGQLVAGLRDYADLGFTPLADEWRRHDFLCGRAVTIQGAAEPVNGVARGIAADGALLLERPEGLATVFSGEVSVRTAA